MLSQYKIIIEYIKFFNYTCEHNIKIGIQTQIIQLSHGVKINEEQNLLVLNQS